MLGTGNEASLSQMMLYKLNDFLDVRDIERFTDYSMLLLLGRWWKPWEYQASEFYEYM